MRFDITALALVAFIAPSVLAKTWDVNVVNGLFSPQELDIAPGDTVNWPNNDGADHAIVETNAGARTCNSKAGGFNSGRKMKGQAYSRVFPTAGVVNYKDGIGANCMKGATGTIFVGPRPTGADPNASSTTSSSMGTATSSGATTTASSTAQPVVTPSPTNKPNSAYGFSASENALFLGAACFVGALVGF
ncbi:hypothetical protein BGZ88_009602 [Linnemannia elongata]|uniref:Cupredoxin n=1 Tax=Linnemannia elongata AG-77 TaxID=1314771 RepID=A0A197JXU9_9FUNG|nr:hypothetical protein BGZ88_009602 [Linnemannia elongata]OAQ30152.1 hypothetical protein K457DRAFT_893164 [Linnemannia elongata AG-77]